MDYKTISQLMMEDVSMTYIVEERGIPLSGFGVTVPVDDLRKAAESKSFRCDTASWMYMSSSLGAYLIDQFCYIQKNNPELGTRDDLVHYLANCLNCIDTIETAVKAECLNFEHIALNSMKNHTVVEGEYMHLVQCWCRENNCLDILPQMTTFVFCRAVQIKKDKKKK